MGSGRDNTLCEYLRLDAGRFLSEVRPGQSWEITLLGNGICHRKEAQDKQISSHSVLSFVFNVPLSILVGPY
jgi:hypothetical protein